jgi:hypothetical protein
MFLGILSDSGAVRDPILKWIFPAFSGADSLEGDFDESGNLDHGRYVVVGGEVVWTVGGGSGVAVGRRRVVVGRRRVVVGGRVIVAGALYN